MSKVEVEISVRIPGDSEKMGMATRIKVSGDLFAMAAGPKRDEALRITCMRVNEAFIKSYHAAMAQRGSGVT